VATRRRKSPSRRDDKREEHNKTSKARVPTTALPQSCRWREPVPILLERLNERRRRRFFEEKKVCVSKQQASSPTYTSPIQTWQFSHLQGLYIARIIIIKIAALNRTLKALHEIFLGFRFEPPRSSPFSLAPPQLTSLATASLDCLGPSTCNSTQ